MKYFKLLLRYRQLQLEHRAVLKELIESRQLHLKALGELSESREEQLKLTEALHASAKRNVHIRLGQC